MQNKKLKKIIIISSSSLVFLYFSTVFYRAYTIINAKNPAPLTENQKIEFEQAIKRDFEIQNSLIRPLPYAERITPFELNLTAKATIVIDESTGCILYEKNPDEIIPPASMTKIFVLNEVFKEIDTGRISLNDIVPLPPECWACNMMPHSSLMFLGKNQIVTLKELMLGSAICSGNDASYAIAYYVCGGMDSFIKRMNDTTAQMGLKNTHFVESSGYSEKNLTTPREMAIFSRYYLQKHPESLELFHSQKSFKYPKEQNLAPEDKGKPTKQDFSQGLPENITMGIYQKNTNPLLDKLEGCDGLKTGYIDESGYNLSLTVKRGNMRIIAIIMGGAGNTPIEGNENRIKDGSEITEWAYNTFALYENPKMQESYCVPHIYARSKKVNLLPAYNTGGLVVPKNIAKESEKAANEVKVELNLPKIIKGKTTAGEIFGYKNYSVNGHTLESIPLVADRTENKILWPLYLADFLAKYLVTIFQSRAINNF